MKPLRRGSPKIRETQPLGTAANRGRALKRDEDFIDAALRAFPGGLEAISDQQLAEALNRRGFLTPRNQQWAVRNIGRMRAKPNIATAFTTPPAKAARSRARKRRTQVTEMIDRRITQVGWARIDRALSFMGDSADDRERRRAELSRQNARGLTSGEEQRLFEWLKECEGDERLLAEAIAGL
jgi:hypothetical protein